MNPDLVETALMHILEVDANTSEMRLAAMHQINPLHTFMFNSRGKLLNANAAAIAACDIPGILPLTVYGVLMQLISLHICFEHGHKCSDVHGCTAEVMLFSWQHALLQRHVQLEPDVYVYGVDCNSLAALQSVTMQH